ncbi:MAG: hypothetical protein JWQ98_2478 [Chlorobi bacterium]|nr:hypothetical protein [Chlorobiota bacterium]
MKKTTTLCIIAFLFLGVSLLHAQLVVPSSERTQPLILCGDIAQTVTVPFDMMNIGTTDLIIDSAIASGDTIDFTSNIDPGSGALYLNPILWHYVNGKTLSAGSISFAGFSFIPGATGTRSILVNIYYHMDQDSVPLTTQAQFTMHVADAKPGLGFLSTRIDTVYSSASTFAVTYDRVLIQDTLFLTDSVSVYDSVRFGANGLDNVYLTSCDSIYVTQIVTDGVLGDDRFTVYAPKGSFSIKAGDTIPVDLSYIPVTQTPKSRTVTIRFFTSDGKVSVIKLRVIVRDPASGVEDERGRVSITSPVLTGAPNPFQNITTLHVALGHAAHVRLTVADALGGQVSRLVDGDLEAGAHQVPFDATGLPAGTYFARLEAGGRVMTMRLVLMK